MWHRAILTFGIACAAPLETGPPPREPEPAPQHAPVAEPKAPASKPLKQLHALKPPRLDHLPATDLVKVQTSSIPGAGQGLFAIGDIPKDRLIGFYSGDYLTPELSEALTDTNSREAEYLFFLPDCAHEETYESIAGDMEHYISKVNFAPATINGTDTALQNVEFRYSCWEPYVRLFATRPIAAGEELFADYGPDYDYFFMEIVEVQDHFLEVTGIEKQSDFSWEYEE